MSSTHNSNGEAAADGLSSSLHPHPQHPDDLLPVVRFSSSSSSSPDIEKVVTVKLNDAMGKAQNSTVFVPRRKIDINWSDLTYSVSQGYRKAVKTILKQVNGGCRAGELMGIMGPSGAGKSTLLNILAGYKIRSVTGTVVVNQKERDLKVFRKLSCYILQDQYLLPQLTVTESMMVAVNLTLPSSTSTGEKLQVVDNILRDMWLTECKKTSAGKLSGGERKRLSIALELVNNPPVMFFDEPTSGLDSSSCIQCINILKSLANGGRTIICSVHQPSAKLFEQFDTLYMMADGECTYYGKVSNVISFMKSFNLECPSYHNPADFVMEVACNEYGDYNNSMVKAIENGKSSKWLGLNDRMSADCEAVDVNVNKKAPDTKAQVANNKDVYISVNGDKGKAEEENSCESSLMHNDDEEVITGYATGYFRQFQVLFVRIFFSHLRDPIVTALRFFVHIVTGIMIGILYWGLGNDASKIYSNSGCLFFSLLFLLFTALMPTILIFPMEIGVLVREYLNSWYSIRAYYTARTMADIPFQIVFAVVYGAIVYFMTGQPNELWRFFMFLFFCIMLTLIAQSVGLLIGAAVPSLEFAIFLGPAAVIPFLLFSGFFITVNAIPVYLRWIAYISYVRYAFEGVVLTVYGYNRPDLVCDQEEYCHFMDPVKFLEEMGFENSSIYVDIGALIAFFLFFRIATYALIHLKIYLKR